MFIVFVVFYMIIIHKSKDIGILRSVGISSGNVLGLFLGFAFLEGAIGSLLGSLLGWGFLANINRIEDFLTRNFGFQLWDRSIYAIGDIPNQISADVLVGIILIAIFSCLLGAAIPSWRAARMKPVDALVVSQVS